MYSNKRLTDKKFVKNLETTERLRVNNKSDYDSKTDTWTLNFTNSHIDLVTRGKFERFLEDVLNMPVDLVVVNKDSSPYLLCNIFEFGENFSNWFDKFYDETLIDRELYFLYMEEKNRYVQY